MISFMISEVPAYIFCTRASAQARGNRVFSHVAVAAKQLHADIGDLKLRFSRPKLSHRCGRDVELLLKVKLQAAVDKCSAYLKLGAHLGELESGVLKFGQWATEGLTFFT